MEYVSLYAYSKHLHTAVFCNISIAEASNAIIINKGYNVQLLL